MCLPVFLCNIYTALHFSITNMHVIIMSEPVLSLNFHTQVLYTSIFEHQGHPCRDGWSRINLRLSIIELVYRWGRGYSASCAPEVTGMASAHAMLYCMHRARAHNSTTPVVVLLLSELGVRRSNQATIACSRVQAEATVAGRQLLEYFYDNRQVLANRKQWRLAGRLLPGPVRASYIAPGKLQWCSRLGDNKRRSKENRRS